ncbi:MAG: MoxR family ATPase [Lachnospiraceae bacterium]|nr:MoxR family ATPase [Lachnospiraceae bacterium]
MSDAKLKKLTDEMNRFFAGKPEAVENLLCCFLAGGHLLLEDVPGVGKTTLAKTFANLLGLSFGRIQMTPDTMPGDVTGLSVYDMKTGEFVFRPGAVMKNIVLADELNRTSPKTQSALLEAMAEGQVTVDDKIYELPQPFMVIATQNPASFTGTYPLPEAQLDRFMMRLSIGYPQTDEELRMARMHMEGLTPEKAVPVMDPEDIEKLRADAQSVHISDSILSYMQKIIDITRKDSGFTLGASPRAFLHLLAAVRALAFIRERDFVKPDDVKAVASAVLSHRLVISTEMRLQQKTASNILEALILKIPVPMD